MLNEISVNQNKLNSVIAPEIISCHLPAMTETEALIRDIERAAAAHRIAAATLCDRAVKNGNLYRNLIAGGSTTLATATRLRAWIINNTPANSEARA